MADEVGGGWITGLVPECPGDDIEYATSGRSQKDAVLIYGRPSARPEKVYFIFAIPLALASFKEFQSQSFASGDVSQLSDIPTSSPKAASVKKTSPTCRLMNVVKSFDSGHEHSWLFSYVILTTVYSIVQLLSFIKSKVGALHVQLR